MRILIDALPVGNASGTGYYVQKLVAGLAAVPGPHEYVAITPPLRRDDLDTPDWPGGGAMQVIEAAPRQSGLQAAWRQWRLGSVARQYGADLVHYPAFIASLRCAVPAVVTIPDAVWRVHRDTVPVRKRRYYDRMIPRSMERARRIIAISGATAAELGRLYPAHAANVRCVPLGVDRGVFAPPEDASRLARVRAAYGLPERFILALSTLEPRKNLPRLIQAFELLAPGLPGVALVLAGKAGFRADRLRARAEGSPVADRIQLPGHIAAADLSVVYGLAAVFALPSLGEGFGLPVLEAMACGVPVVTADRSATREVAGDAAELVDPDSPEAIADGLRRVLGDPSRWRELRDRGLRRVADYPWERTARETVRVYEEAAS